MEPIVIARAPGHLVLGCDQSFTYEHNAEQNQSVVVATVNYYAYAIVSSNRVDCLQIILAGQQTLPWRLPDDERAWGERLILPNAIAELFGIHEGLTVFLSTQAPHGVGLGLSSSLTISMIKALAFSCGLDLGPLAVADLACHVRTETLGLSDDSFGQYAVACGGLNHIDVDGKRLRVRPVEVAPEVRSSLEKQLMLFTTQDTPSSPVRAALSGEAEHSVGSASTDRYETSGRVNRHIRFALEEGDLPAFAGLLHQAWLYQAQALGDSGNDLLSRSYEAARACGAMGGQRVKAYNRDTLLLFCPEQHQPSVTDSLTALGLKQWPIALEDDGVQVMEVTPRTRPMSSAPLPEALPFGNLLPYAR